MALWHTDNTMDPMDGIERVFRIIGRTVAMVTSNIANVHHFGGFELDTPC